jgi:death-on-curing protein
LATEYLDLDDAFDAHAEALEISVEDAKAALLNPAQLESALARPRNAAVYEGADMVRQAATLFWGVASMQAFSDGNKRTAVVLLRAFLNLNGYDLTLSDDERFELTLAVAATGASLGEVEARLRTVVVPL